MTAFKYLILLFLIAAVAQSARRRPDKRRSRPYKSYIKVCKHGQSVGGISGSRKKGDVRFAVFCREIDHSKTFRHNGCHWAEEFELLNGAGEILANNMFGSESNCKQGEYLSGVKSKFVKGETHEKNIRKFKFRCCGAANARVDNEVGCHLIGPRNPFDPEVHQSFFILKNEHLHKASRKVCPTDVLTGVKITPEGMTAMYCPYRVGKVKYPKKCKSLKEGIETVNEAGEIIVVETVAPEETTVPATTIEVVTEEPTTAAAVDNDLEVTTEEALETTTEEEIKKCGNRKKHRQRRRKH